MITAATAATEYVTINDDRIAYRKIGSGSPIVLANRMRGTLDTWDPLFLDHLAAQHTVITFDYPGIGYSSGALPREMSEIATFLREFARTLGLVKFAMAGWSFGGFLAQTLAFESPELVTHAILIGTNPAGHNEHPIKQVFLDRALKPVNDLEDEEVLFFEPASERSRIAARQSRERIHTARPDVVS
jgi:pimeloyl-ACP methyl ester carboxylesterase